MKKIFFLVVLFVGICGISKSSQAATYYADFQNGNDSNGGLSTESAWKYAPGMSGWSGSSTLANGDTVVLKGGVTWTFISTTDYLWTIPAQITVIGGQQLGTPWGSGYPVLDGFGSTVSRRGISILSKSNVSIDGIKIINLNRLPLSGGLGITFFGSLSNLEIKNCYMDSTGDSSITGSPGDGSSHILIHDNITANVARMFIAVSDGSHVDDIQIYNNTFHGTGTYNVAAVHGDGIMIGSACSVANTCLTNLSIHHNKFLGNWTHGATAHIYLNNGTGSGVTLHGGNHVRIYDNQFAIDSDGIISPAFIYIYSRWNDIQIYNNTFGAYMGGSNPVSSCIMTTGASTGIVIKNNLFSGCISRAIGATVDTEGEITADYNMYTAGVTRFLDGWNGNQDCRSIAACQGAPFFQEAHGVYGNPAFVKAPDGTSGDWRITADSNAIGRGADLSGSALYNDDLLGISRPQGSTWDIGAYEYASGGDATAPEAPAGLIIQ